MAAPGAGRCRWRRFALNRAPQTTAGGETKHAKWTFGMKGNDSPRAPANMRTYFAIPASVIAVAARPRAAPRVAPCTCAYMRKRAAHGAPRRRRVSGTCSDGAPPRGRVTTVPAVPICRFHFSLAFRFVRDGSSTGLKPSRDMRRARVRTSPFHRVFDRVSARLSHQPVRGLYPYAPIAPHSVSDTRCIHT